MCSVPLFAKAKLVQLPLLNLLIIFTTPPPPPIPFPHTKYNVTVEVEKLENHLCYLLSDNPACTGRFLREENKPKPHYGIDIRPCKREANRILDKLHAITENIIKHIDNLFTEGGKLKTGLNCQFTISTINEKRHHIKSGVEKNVLHLVEDLDRAGWLNIRRHIKLAQNPQHLKQEKGKSREK